MLLIRHDLLRQHHRRVHVLRFESRLLHGRKDSLLRSSAVDVLQGRILRLNPVLLQWEVLRQTLAPNVLRHDQQRRMLQLGPGMLRWQVLQIGPVCKQSLYKRPMLERKLVLSGGSVCAPVTQESSRVIVDGFDGGS